ncbi:MAG: polysaccharide pyruvyl transferase family protein [Paracoccaceae bacterium]
MPGLRSAPDAERPRGKPLTVLLIFHSSRSNNLGVGALTVSEIEIVRAAALRAGRRVRIEVVEWKENRAPYLSGPDITLREIGGPYIRNPFGFFRDALRADLVIDIGAGDSFADIYGRRRLTRMFAMKFLTHLAGTPLVVAPQTIGPFRHRLSAWLARATLNASAVVATRDRLSTDCVRGLGVGREVIDASDVALRLPFVPARRLPGPPRVGINVSGLLVNGGYDRRNMFGLTVDYPALIDRLVAAFRAHPEGCEVHLVPHVVVDQPDSTEDDYAASVAVAARHPGVIVAPRFHSPSDAKGYIAGMDFFTGARMHSCIAAFSSGVPVVPMAYSRKFAGLFGSLGYHRTVDCAAADADEILAAILGAFDKRNALSGEVSAALAEGLIRLSAYEDALTGIMARR